MKKRAEARPACRGFIPCASASAWRQQAAAALVLATLAARPCGAAPVLHSPGAQLNRSASAVALPRCLPSAARDSPWFALRECANVSPHALLETRGTNWTGPRWDQLAGILIFFAAVAFAMFSIKDVHNFVLLLVKAHPSSQHATPDGGKASFFKALSDEGFGLQRSDSGDEDTAVGDWSITGLVLLTAYRFYTGFMSATWVPYLLAMEGQYLWPDKQALFMALAKLIYGVSILLNPVFGLVGDGAVSVSHGFGRKLFIRGGLTIAAMGLYICVLSGRDRAFLSFLSGILVWRIGEALNDVTTEALVPEMVNAGQFQVASAIKASSFLLGGLFGYVLLIVLADVHYSWLYYAYPIGMFVASLPPLYLLTQKRPFVHAVAGPEEESFWDSIVEAYRSPLRYPGGFPRACLAVFVFSLGTAPMFYLLLIVRDLVGVTDPVAQQQQFSIGSIVFFLSAAAASCLVAFVQKRQVAPGAAAVAGQGEGQAQSRAAAAVDVAAMEAKGRLLVGAMVSFGAVVFVLPCLALLDDLKVRDDAFYLLTVVFGAAFGAAFTLFQDLTWQLLPPGIRVANAMGFNVMSRLFGVGLGNFISGLMLDVSYSEEKGGYSVVGYTVMCTFSGIVVLLSIPLAHSVIGMAKREELEPLMGRSAVPAA